MSEILCIGCGAPRQADTAHATPGVTPYLPCAICGAIGIRREGDPDTAGSRRKKPARDLYERSRYRGGKLVQRAAYDHFASQLSKPPRAIRDPGAKDSADPQAQRATPSKSASKGGIR